MTNSKKYHINLSLLSYWHAGSGCGRSAEADALVLKDRHGLPYLPGRTVKGLLREGMRSCEDAGVVEPGTTDVWFGKAAKNGDFVGSEKGRLFFGDAELQEEEKKWLGDPENSELKKSLYEYHASTRIDENGVAEDQTLRTIELCVPLELFAEVSGPGDEWVCLLQKACVFVRSLGSHRNRGLGRCVCSVREVNERHG